MVGNTISTTSHSLLISPKVFIVLSSFLETKPKQIKIYKFCTNCLKEVSCHLHPMKRAYADGYKKSKFAKSNKAKKFIRKPYGRMQPPRWIGISKGAMSELKVCDVSSDDLQITAQTASTISTSVDNTTAAATHNIACLNTMAQGTDMTGRVGRKLRCMSVLLDLIAQPLASSSTNVGDIMRIVLFWDLQSNNATTFTLANLFLDFSANGSSGTTAPINLNNRDRFRILMDKRVALQPVVYSGSAVSTGSPVTRNIKKYIKLGDVSTTLNDTGSGVYGDISSGALMLLVYSEYGKCQYVYTARTRFSDN